MMKKLLYLFMFLPVLSFGQILSQDFEDGTFPPSGWTVTQTNVDETWQLEEENTLNGAGSAHVAYSVDPQDERLTSPSFSLVGQTTAFLSFNVALSYYWAVDPNDNYDVTAEVSTDGGTTWTSVWSEVDLGEFASFDPYFITVDLAAYVGNPDVRVSFHYVGADGADLLVDDVMVSAEEPALPFPSPYCNVDDAIGVEPITLFTFAGISSTTSPELDETDTLLDYTDQVGTVEIGNSYPVVLEGNTGGNYEDFFTLFIDWNQDGSFDGDDERFEIGSITDSDGTDTQQATGNVVVPATALSGTTRLRVVKNYDATALDACDPGDGFYFGQVQDYTLQVNVLAAPIFDANAFSVYPNPVKDIVNINYSQDITAVAFYNLLGQKVLERNVNATEGKVDVSALASGTYLMKVNTSDNLQKTVKLIKQ